MPINNGYYSKVHIITDIKNDKYAVKIFKVKNIDHFNNEISILSELDHPNIVYMFNYNSSLRKDYILLEYCRGGDLQYYINNYYVKHNRQLCLRQVKLIFKQILEGVLYLHTRQICHRDLKLENILISDIEIESIKQIKICDFGFSTKNNSYCDVAWGSIDYISPEVNTKYPNGFKIDIWALGVILYLLLKSEFPFKKSKYLEVCSIIDLQVISFLGKMLHINPLIRADAKDLLMDEWFNISNKRKLETS